MALLIRDDQQYKELLDAEKLVEDMHFEVAIAELNSNAITVAIYKSPNANDDIFLNKMESLLQVISTKYPNKQLYFCGDFNIDITASTAASKSLINVMAEFGLKPCFTEPSRVQRQSATCIDNIFSNVPQYTGITFDPHISDHRAQCLTIRTACNPSLRPRKTKVRIINERNINILATNLGAVDWSGVFSILDPEEAFDRFFDTLNAAVDEACPLRTITVKPENSRRFKWYIKELKGIKQTLDALEVMARVEKRMEIKLAKKNSNNKEIQDSDDKQKAIWNVIKRETAHSPLDDQECITDAEHFNKFFAEMGLKVQDDIDKTKLF